MKRILRNIFRLPEIYLPLVAFIVLTVLLLQISFSVWMSAQQTDQELGNAYPASIRLSVKVRNERVIDEKGRTDIINTNTKTIGRELLQQLTDHPDTGNITYYSNRFILPLFQLCPEEAYDNIAHSIAENQPFSLPPRSYTDAFLTRSDLTVLACNDPALLEEVLGISPGEIRMTYTGQSGVLLPKPLYDLWQKPDRLIAGWFAREMVGYRWEQTDAGIQVPASLRMYMEELVRGAAEPALPIAVRGYYETENALISGMVLCDAESWAALYSAGYDGADAHEEIGFALLQADLSSADRAEAVIRDILTTASAEDYLLTADDYAYKFAAAQLDGLLTLSRVTFWAAVLFGGVVMVLVIPYSLKRRRGEIYTLRTLGENNFRIKAALTGEFSCTLFSAVLLGMGISAGVGEGICRAVGALTREKAASSVETLSESLAFMKNNTALREQLTQAIDAFSRVDFSIQYTFSPALLAAILLGVLFFHLLIWGILTAYTHTNMMKKGE